jgi:ankyrin repeat protein
MVNRSGRAARMPTPTGTAHFGRVVLALVFAIGGVGAAHPELPLQAAIKDGAHETIRTLIGQVDVNAADVAGTTALHLAVHHDDRETVRLLLSAGATVHATTRYGVTPLSLACVNGNAAIVAALLAAGADANSLLPGGETALLTAARTGAPAVVKALLAHGANLQVRDGWRGQTPLMWAAAENNADVAQLLIDAGSDVHARSAGGGQFTALLFAVRAGHIETSRVLLGGGANVNDLLPGGVTPLLLAVINANYELAALLLESGADPNANASGWTALHQVAWTRRPNIGSNNPEPVLSGELDSLELVTKLVEHGAQPNARVTKEPRGGLSALNRIGATPFLLAAKSADVDLMRALVANGADPLLTNVDHTTPLMVAAGVGIFAPGEDPGTNDEASSAVRLALELGGDVTAVNALGETALHGAATRGADEIVRLLVAKGARLDVKNKKGWTPLTIADGIMLGGTFKRQPKTAALLRELMNPPSSR